MRFNLKRAGIRHGLSHLRSHDPMDPSRDWFIILTLAAVVLLGGASYIAYDFYQQFGTVREAAVTTESVEYKPDDVVYYAKMYDEEEVAFSHLREDRNYVPEDEVEDEVEDDASSTTEEIAGDTAPLAEVLLAQ